MFRSLRQLIGLATILFFAFMLGLQEIPATAGSIIGNGHFQGEITGSGSDEPDDKHAKEYNGLYKFSFTYTIKTTKDGAFDPSGSNVTITGNRISDNLGFSTLPIPITAAYFAGLYNGGPQVSEFDYSGKWYPGAGGEGIEDTGASGIFTYYLSRDELRSVSITATYTDTSTGSKYKYVFSDFAVPEPSSWLLFLFGLITVWLGGHCNFSWRFARDRRNRPPVARTARASAEKTA